MNVFRKVQGNLCDFHVVELLPGPPENVEVEPLGERSLKVEWSMPRANSHSISEFAVNLTALKSFDLNSEEDTQSNITGNSIIRKVLAQLL